MCNTTLGEKEKVIIIKFIKYICSNKWTFFKLESFENIVAKKEQCFQMLSAAADVKTSIYGFKCIKIYPNVGSINHNSNEIWMWKFS